MKEQIKISDGIYLHVINTNIFKTDFISAFILTKLDRENVTKNALIPAVLRRGTEKLPTMKDISIKLEEMYGSIFDASSDKFGDLQALQFYITYINNEYTINGENLLDENIDLLCDVMLSPKLVNGIFDETYVTQEKETIREIIKGKINNKSSYAINRMIEEMCKDEPYGLYKYGYISDLDEINAGNLYEQYKNILETSEIHIFISGNVDDEKISSKLKNRFEVLNRSYKEKVLKLQGHKDTNKVDTIFEKQDVTQGKLVLGYNVDIDIFSDDFYKMLLYTAILGGSPSSKLFQNVREKESLAYTTRASYIKHKGILIVSAGIEIDNYEKALGLIKKQEEDMRNGDFTDENLFDAKIFLKNVYKSFEDEQSAIINLYMGQQLLDKTESIDQMIEKVQKVTKEDIVNVANKIKLNTIYFLTNKKQED